MGTRPKQFRDDESGTIDWDEEFHRLQLEGDHPAYFSRNYLNPNYLLGDDMQGNIGIDPGIPLKLPDIPQIKTSTKERTTRLHPEIQHPPRNFDLNRRMRLCDCAAPLHDQLKVR
jgi:hypothetical protein